MFDVELTKTKEEINAFTDILNGLVPGIRFKPKIREDKIDFLDTTVTIENGYLITSPYSKTMNSKQYLIPSSVHKENVVDNIPKTVGLRLRRLSSDRVEGDRIFADALDDYCLTKISIRATRSISRVFSLFIVPRPFFVHCPYKGRINRAESVLTGLKPYFGFCHCF